MTLSRPLLWKESAEVRPILFLGLFIFLVFPAIGALEHLVQYRSLEIWTSPWVFGLGGILAAVTAVGVIMPDVTRRLEFIRSQPIPLSRWLLTKYGVGLAVLLIVLTIPLAINFVLDRRGEISGYHLNALLLALPFTWIAIYSVTFALACLIRRTALATVAGVFAMLLIYFAPPIIPGLQFVSLNKVTDELSHVIDLGDWTGHADQLSFHAGYFLFAGTMLAISAVAVMVAIKVMHRDWRIESNRKTVVWTIGIGALVLPLVASLQLGTNMPLLQKIELDPGEHAVGLMHHGDGQYMLTHEWATPRSFLRPLTTGGQISLGPKIEITNGSIAFAPGNDIVYGFSWLPTADPRFPPDLDGRPSSYPTILATRLGGTSPETTSLELKDVLSMRYGQARFIFGDSKMTIVSGRMQLDFDVSNAMHPKLVASKEFTADCGFREVGNIMQFHYPLDMSIPPDQLIAAEEKFHWYGSAFTPQLGVMPVHGGLRCYTRADSGPGYVNFKPAGKWSFSPVEQLVLSGFDPQIALQSGLALAGSRGSHAARFMLFDIADPSRPTVKGYYALPYRVGDVLGFLPDERVLVGDHTIYVLGKPGT